MTANHSESYSADSNIATYVQLFLERLDALTWERPLKKLVTALREGQTAEAGTTLGIFHEQDNFAAGYAYCITKYFSELATHFTGKVACLNMIAYIETRSTEYRRLLAKTLAETMTSAQIEKINKIRQSVSQPDVDKARKRPRTEDLNSFNLNSRDSPPSETEEEAPQLELSCDSFVAEAHVVVHASLRASTRLFPLYLSSAIKRVPDPKHSDVFAASIAMTFPDAPITSKIGCQMNIEIAANKVEHIAERFFNAHLETTAGLRYLCLPRGTKVLPNPKLTLRGCPDTIISSEFGVEVSDAIQASPVYQEDVKLGHECTDSVSLVISQGSNDSAFLLLSLGSRGGILIKDKLYD